MSNRLNQNNTPLISIVVPVYNVEKTLEQCVLSVLNQTYKNIEIILVDDGSKDNSKELCDVLKLKDSRILVIHKTNGGLSDARNCGLKQANGEFIAFVDSDDVINKNFIEYLFKLQQEHNADIVSCNFEKFYSYENVPDLDYLNSKPNIIIKNGKDCIKEYLDRKTSIKIYHNVWNKLYKKELFNDCEFKKGKYHEDLFITYKLISKCKCLVSSDAVLYYYFKGNKNSIVSTYSAKHFLDQCEAINEIYEYFKDEKDLNKELSYFIVNNAKDIYLLGYNIHNNVINKAKKELRNLIIECSKNIRQVDRIKVYIKLLFPNLFVKRHN